TVAITPDGRTVLHACRSGIRDLPAAGRPFSPAWAGSEEGVWAAALSPDGATLATAHADHRTGRSGFDHVVRLWSVAQRRCFRELRGHTQRAEAVAFSPEGRVVAAAGGASLGVWEATDGRLLALRKTPRVRLRGVAFTRAGGLLVGQNTRSVGL